MLSGMHGRVVHNNAMRNFMLINIWGTGEQSLHEQQGEEMEAVSDGYRTSGGVPEVKVTTRSDVTGRRIHPVSGGTDLRVCRRRARSPAGQGCQWPAPVCRPGGPGLSPAGQVPSCR